jgi:hypothetical protein
MKCPECDGKGKYKHNGLTYDKDTGEERFVRKLRGVLVQCRLCGGKGEVKQTYVIRQKGHTSLYWSNLYGWVDKFYDIFTEDDLDRLNLPLNGEWVSFNA